MRAASLKPRVDYVEQKRRTPPARPDAEGSLTRMGARPRKMIITRRRVVQIDLPDPTESGLVDAVAPPATRARHRVLHAHAGDIDTLVQPTVKIVEAHGLASAEGNPPWTGDHATLLGGMAGQ